MPRVAITVYSFPDLELERAILSAAGFELRSRNDKEIPALKSLVVEADEFDWRKQEERLNRLPHALSDIEGLRRHFIHQPGNGSAPLPLFMMHGYPWSFVLLERILPMLTDPAPHGGDPRNAFTVIVPSIIEFGCSAYPPQQVFGFQQHPRIYDRLMTEELRYALYGIEGGDWGGFLTAPSG